MSAQLPEFTEEQYPADLELKLLQVVHRHGERTPIRRRLDKIFPPVWNLCESNTSLVETIGHFNQATTEFTTIPVQRIIDTGKAEKAGSCYYGQLTNMGRAKMSSLGVRLREAYIDKLKYLPDVFDEETVYIRSTDYPRTRESVQQLIAGGLYPADKRPEGFQLKLRIRDPQDDNLFPNPSCLRLRALSEQFLKTVAVSTKEECDQLSKLLKNHVKSVSIVGHPSASGILDTLISAKTHGFEMPEDIGDEVFDRLEKLVVKEWFHGAANSTEVTRLSSGRLMGDIRDRMVRRKDGQDEEGEEKMKMAVYSGHDTTIAPLLVLMNSFDDKWPPYGSIILFELFKAKEKQDHFVRVRYNEKALQLPGCADKGQHKEGDPSLCTIDAFKRIVKDFVPTDYKNECAV